MASLPVAPPLRCTLRLTTQERHEERLDGLTAQLGAIARKLGVESDDHAKVRHATSPLKAKADFLRRGSFSSTASQPTSKRRSS